MGGHVNDSSLPPSPGGRIEPGQCSYYSGSRCEEKLRLVSPGLWRWGVARNEHIGASVGFTMWR